MAHQLTGGTRQALMSMDAYEAGVLTVRLPVAEQAKPRKVAITTGRGQQALEAGAQAA